MLSNSTISIVKSTVPLLEEHGLAITSVFYQRLFTECPELQHLFNRSNQRDSSQSRALADAVLAYANYIDNIAVLVPAVKRIANKHASIGIQAEHYPLVGASLIAAIQQVLALPDEHPALAAWSEAYGVLADIFIDAEASLYQESETQDGGWVGFREFELVNIKKETPEVDSFTLRPVDKGQVLDFSAGQYVGIKLPAADGEYDQIRQYSLSAWHKGPTSEYKITVKSEPQGHVSANLHRHRIGDKVLISAPRGEFTLSENSSRHVFISGGVGITPLFSMLQQAISHGGNQQSLSFIECCRGAEHQIFKPELTQLADQAAVRYKCAFEFGDGGDFSGRLDEHILDQWIPDKSAQVYFCGPLPFMSALKTLLNSIGFSDEQLHYEVFGPTTAL